MKRDDAVVATASVVVVLRKLLRESLSKSMALEFTDVESLQIQCGGSRVFMATSERNTETGDCVNARLVLVGGFLGSTSWWIGSQGALQRCHHERSDGWFGGYGAHTSLFLFSVRAKLFVDSG